MLIRIGTGGPAELGDGCTQEMAVAFAARCEQAIEAATGHIATICTPDQNPLRIVANKGESLAARDHAEKIVREVIDAEWQRFVNG